MFLFTQLAGETYSNRLTCWRNTQKYLQDVYHKREVCVCLQIQCVCRLLLLSSHPLLCTPPLLPPLSLTSPPPPPSLLHLPPSPGRRQESGENKMTIPKLFGPSKGASPAWLTDWLTDRLTDLLTAPSLHSLFVCIIHSALSNLIPISSWSSNLTPTQHLCSLTQPILLWVLTEPAGWLMLCVVFSLLNLMFGCLFIRIIQL